MWNADQAEQSSDTRILEAIVPHDRKEAALTLFHFNSYKIDGISSYWMLLIHVDLASSFFLMMILPGILGLILQTKPKHGMDWSIETKQAFERSIIKSRKDFVYVSKVVRQSVGDCLNYYYACFKQMSEYGSLKKLLGEDLEKKRRLNVCAKCNKDGELVCCSICQSSYHSQCCTYLPTNSETSDWFCDDCDPQD